MRDINRIIIHSTATPEGRYTSVADVTRWHLARGFATIGYHYLVYIDGTIAPGREINLAGAHARGVNFDSIGIAYVGGTDIDGLSKDTMNDSQYKSMVVLISSIRTLFGEHVTIHGHNEFSNKRCPGFNVKEKFNKKEILCQCKKTL